MRLRQRLIANEQTRIKGLHREHPTCSVKYSRTVKAFGWGFHCHRQRSALHCRYRRTFHGRSAILLFYRPAICLTTNTTHQCLNFYVEAISQSRPFLTSFPSCPAVHDSLECFKLVLLELGDVFAQNFHQVVRVRLQLLVLLVADVDGGLAPRAPGRHLLVVAALVLRGRAVLGLFLFLAAAFLAISIAHPVVRREAGEEKQL